MPWDPPEPFRGRYPHPYDGEVAAADAVVGGLLDHLRQIGVYDRAIVIVTSDHGEGLGDHGEEQHSILLYREAIQVPLLLKLPGSLRAGERVKEPAQLADILPTVAELVGVAGPEDLLRTLPADAGRRRRGAARALRGDALPAAAPRVERAAVRGGRALALRLRPAAGALRPGEGPARDDRPAWPASPGRGSACGPSWGACPRERRRRRPSTPPWPSAWPPSATWAPCATAGRAVRGRTRATCCRSCGG